MPEQVPSSIVLLLVLLLPVCLAIIMSFVRAMLKDILAHMADTQTIGGAQVGLAKQKLAFEEKVHDDAVIENREHREFVERTQAPRTLEDAME
jgi:hypothetical protein